MKIQYETSAVSTGGRDGTVKVENSSLEFEMALPAELGGNKKNGVNPEQLFAAGYSACFGSAVQHVLRVRKLSIKVPTIHVKVRLGRNEEGNNALAVDIQVVFSDIDPDLAEDIVEEAHQICPYSNATRGNIDVTVTSRVE